MSATTTTTTIAIAIAIAIATGADATPSGSLADSVYTGGPLATMIRGGDRRETLALRDGWIVASVDRDVVLAMPGPATGMVYLQGRARLRGLIDVQPHVIRQAPKSFVSNLDPAPKATRGRSQM